MKNFLLEHTDYLTDCMITYIKKTKLVRERERERESFIRNNVHSGVVSGAAR